MEKKIYELKEGFNSILNIIENCDISTPPYSLNKMKNNKIFFKKRIGVSSYNNIGSSVNDISYYSDSSNDKKLALTSSDLYEFSDTSKTSIGSVSSDSKIIDIESIGGTNKDSGTATGGDNPVGSIDAYLEDTSKTWTTNEFAGMYIWLNSGTGNGDIVYIKGNDSTKIYVEGWTNNNNPDTTTTYIIYSELVNTILVSSESSDTLKVYDGSALQSITSINPIKFAVKFDGRLWYTTYKNPNILWYSEVGQYLLNDGYIIINNSEVTSIKPFGDYLVVGDNDGISAIRKISDDSGVIIYSRSDLVSGLGVAGEKSMTYWNSGFYIIANDNNIYTLSIESKGNDIFGKVENISKKILDGYISSLSITETFCVTKFDEISFI